MEILWSLSLSKGIQRSLLPCAALFENEEEAREGGCFFLPFDKLRDRANKERLMFKFSGR